MIVSSKGVIDVLTISEYSFIQSMNVVTKDSTYFNIKTEDIFPRKKYKRKKLSFSLWEFTLMINIHFNELLSDS